MQDNKQNEKNMDVTRNDFIKTRTQSKFKPVEISPQHNGLTVKFIIHHYAQGLYDIVDGLLPQPFFTEGRKKKDIESYLELKFLYEGDDLFLGFVCHANIDFYNFDLRKLLDAIAPDNLPDLNLTSTKGCVSIGRLNLNTTTLMTSQYIQISEAQANNVLNVLLQHESQEPSSNAWMLEGSINKLKQALELFHRKESNHIAI